MKYLFLLSSFSVLLLAQETLPSIQTDRPDQTEVPYIVPKNYWQIETGYSYEQTNTYTQTFIHPAALIKYGVNENFELRLITELVTEKIASNGSFKIEPIKLGLKVKLFEEQGILPKTSLISHLSVPYLSNHVEAKTFTPSFRFVMQNNVSKNLYLGYNLGAEWEEETKEPTFIYTLVGGGSLTEKIGGYLEVYGFAPQKDTANHRIAGGFTYLIQKNRLLDISGGFGLTENAPNYYIAVGFSARFSRFY